MKRDPKIFRQHFERYIFSTMFCNKKKVLDLGSKDGYGAHLISSYASHVTLVDCIETYLNQAKKYYHFLCPVEFVHIDLDKKFPDGLWDTIVAFEIIEHLDDPDNIVREIVNHLNPGGTLVFSVPHMKPNPVHKTLFDEWSIKDLISKYLSIKEFYVQDSYGISKRLTNNNCYVGVATLWEKNQN